MIQDIVITLSEAQKLIYLPDNHRSPQSLLWLYLVMFVHMLFIKINVFGKVKKLTNLLGATTTLSFTTVLSNIKSFMTD